NVHDMQLATDAPFGPGQSVSVEIEAPFTANRLTIVAMLATTNDTFMALDRYRLSPWFGTRVVTVPAYDAGSEFNSEDCDFVPGPPCGMAGVRDTEGAEGFVSISSGIHGFGDLDPTTHDWRNPVAKITIEPIWR
ncbi:MAG: spondin domain-containing protein, partial [Thermoanaerobaculia bacterium]|nr:spondin domain-containing protein [Thermoanaerobaculia bacterium]